MSSQPRIASSARLRPIRRGRRTVPVPPGMMPRATSGWLKIAVGPAKRMSQLSASSLPPPPTRPSITAIVAFGIWRSCSHMRWYVLSSVGIGCGLGRELEDRGDVEVGDEPLRVRRAEHDDAHVVVDGEPIDRLRQLEVHRHRHQVDRRMVDDDRRDPLVRRDDEIPHGLEPTRPGTVSPTGGGQRASTSSAGATRTR